MSNLKGHFSSGEENQYFYFFFCLKLNKHAVSEKNKVPITLFEARAASGSATDTK